MPPDHTLVAYVDVAALVDSGIWDAMERSPAKLLLQLFRRRFGFDLAEVDRLDVAVTLHPDADDTRERRSVVIILTGGERVGIGKVDLELFGGYRLTESAGHQVLTTSIALSG